MSFYLIETIVGGSHGPDGTGAVFRSESDAVRAAFSALLDVAQDEDELQDRLDIGICVKDVQGGSIFRGVLTTARSGPPRVEATPIGDAEEGFPERFHSA